MFSLMGKQGVPIGQTGPRVGWAVRNHNPKMAIGLLLSQFEGPQLFYEGEATLLLSVSKEL